MRLKQIELVFEALCSVGQYIVMELEGGILQSPAGYGASNENLCVFDACSRACIKEKRKALEKREE